MEERGVEKKKSERKEGGIKEVKGERGWRGRRWREEGWGEGSGVEKGERKGVEGRRVGERGVDGGKAEGFSSWVIGYL